MDHSFKIISREILYEKDNIELQKVIHTLPDGRTAEKAVVQYPEAVAALVFDAKDNLILVKQYRVGAQKDLWEIPAGKIDQGEDLQKALNRELMEEIGYRANSIEYIFSYYPAAGISSEYLHLFMAKNLQIQQMPADEDEFIQVKHFTKTEVISMLNNHEIEDAKTLIALNWFLAQGSIQ